MYNYLIYSKIKIFIFFLKIVVFIKKCCIFASLTTNTNNKNKATMKNNLYIFIENGNIDVVELSGYTREEGIEELMRLQKSYEKMGKRYQFELTDNYGNPIFKNCL